MTVVRRLLLGIATTVLGALVVLAPAPAWAHASLVSSSPTDGEDLTVLPDQVVFTFSEDMSAPAYVVVTAPDGTSVTTGDPVIDGTEVTQAVTGGPPGGYTMAYRAVSADGHPVTGQIQFTVGGDGVGRNDGAVASPAAPAATPAARSGAASTGSSAAGAAGVASAGRAGDSLWARHGMAFVVGVGLFVAAGVLLLLSRRTT